MIKIKSGPAFAGTAFHEKEAPMNVGSLDIAAADDEFGTNNNFMNRAVRFIKQSILHISVRHFTSTTASCPLPAARPGKETSPDSSMQVSISASALPHKRLPP